MTLIKLPDIQGALDNYMAAHQNAGALADPATAQAQALQTWMKAMTDFALGLGEPVPEAPAPRAQLTQEQIDEQAEQIAAQAAAKLAEDLAEAAKGGSAPEAPATEPVAGEPAGEPAKGADPVPTIAPSNAGV